VLLGCRNHSRKYGLGMQQYKTEGNVFRVFIFLFVGKTPLLILMKSLEDNIKMYHEKIGGKLWSAFV
jgi:hypothetical protein